MSVAIAGHFVSICDVESQSIRLTLGLLIHIFISMQRANSDHNHLARNVDWGFIAINLCLAYRQIANLPLCGRAFNQKLTLADGML